MLSVLVTQTQDSDGQSIDLHLHESVGMAGNRHANTNPLIPYTADFCGGGISRETPLCLELLLGNLMCSKHKSLNHPHGCQLLTSTS